MTSGLEMVNQGVSNKSKRDATGAFTLLETDNVIKVTGNTTITLFAITANNLGWRGKIINLGGFTVTLSRAGSDLVNGATTFTPVGNGVTSLDATDLLTWSAQFSNSDAGPVIMSPTAARVTPNGNDATGMVGRFDRPFLTPEAASAAVPFFGSVWIETGTYTVNWTIGNLKNIYAYGVTLQGTVSLSLLSRIYGYQSIFSNCSISTVVGNATKIDGFGFSSSNITGLIQEVLNIPSLSYTGDFYSLGGSAAVGISFAPYAFISGSGGAILKNVGGALSGLNVVISNMKASTGGSNVGTIVDAGVATTGNIITLLDSKVATLGDAFKSAFTGANTITVVLDGSSVKSTGYIYNNSTANGTANIVLRRASEVDSAQAQNIAWSTNPANVVTLKTTPGTLSTKVWDSLGIVNVGASTDYTQVDANLPI